MIRVSAGSAALLDLKKIKCDTLPTTVYLMLGESCKRHCSFCPQGSNSSAKKNLLSRVTWPAFSWDQLQESLARGEKRGLQRICLQVVRQEEKECIKAVKKIKEASSLPVSVSINPSSLQEVAEIMEAGAERISISLDGASPEVYFRIKGGSFARRLELLEKGAATFPGKISTHLIVGLGEKDQDLVQLFSYLLLKRITLALFAFHPVKNTPLEKHPPPSLERYRTLQAAYFLMQKGLCTAENFTFRRGALVSLGLTPNTLRLTLSSGRAFETLGCPGCNRPYYNEKPGGAIYNSPRPLTEGEIEAALKGLETYLQRKDV